MKAQRTQYGRNETVCLSLMASINGNSKRFVAIWLLCCAHNTSVCVCTRHITREFMTANERMDWSNECERAIFKTPAPAAVEIFSKRFNHLFTVAEQVTIDKYPLNCVDGARARVDQKRRLQAERTIYQNPTEKESFVFLFSLHEANQSSWSSYESFRLHFYVHFHFCVISIVPFDFGRTYFFLVVRCKTMQKTSLMEIVESKNVRSSKNSEDEIQIAQRKLQTDSILNGSVHWSHSHVVLNEVL